MKEYIEREAALDIAAEWCPDDDGSVGKIGDLRDMLDELEAIPAADVVEVKHGRWIKTTKVHPDLLNDSTYNYRCSNCGYMDTHGANVEVPYCWHCGAKMTEVRNDNKRWL